MCLSDNQLPDVIFFHGYNWKKNPLLIMASSPFPFSQLLALLYCCSQLTLYLSSILIGALEKIIGFGFCDIQTNQGRRKRHQPSRRLRLMTLTKTLIIPDFTTTQSNNCFIYCFEENKEKHSITLNSLTLLLEIIHNVCNLQISQ